MLAKIIFFTSLSLAILTVILLSLLSPKPHQNPPSLTFSLYIQNPATEIPKPSSNPPRFPPPNTISALTFRQVLTEGPENTSRAIGAAQGFIVPVEKFAYSKFNIIYLTLESSEFLGSLSVEAKDLREQKREQLSVVGGTGSFAFARGVAVFEEIGVHHGSYLVNLQLSFPNKS